MQIQITPTPKPNSSSNHLDKILFCLVDCYENQKVKNNQGKSETVQVKVASLKMIMGDEEWILERVQKRFPKVKPVLIKAKILKSWEK